MSDETAEQTSKTGSDNKAKIKKAEFIGHQLVAVTFDRKLKTVDAADLDFTRQVNTLTIKKAAAGINKNGDTVLLIELADPINGRLTGTNKREANVVQTNSADVNGVTLEKGEQ